MAFGAPIPGAEGFSIRSNYKSKKRTRRRHRRTLMTDRYPRYKIAWEGMQEGGGLQDTLARLAKSGQLKPGMMQDLAPYLALSQTQGDAYQFLQDFQGLDKSMEAYGAGANRIGRGTARAGAAGRSAVGRAGLGGSGAGQALASRAAQSGQTAQGGLFSGMYQRGIQNTNRYAMDAFENQRMITQMALGSVPYPRTRSSSRGGLGQSIGQSIGMLGGMIGQQGGGLGPQDLSSLREGPSPFPY